MATPVMQMTALAIDCEETCAGCFRKFHRGERMTAMQYNNGDMAGWHCDECCRVWKEQGEDKLPRWESQ